MPIEDIIELCERNFTFPINDNSRKTYSEFLERQLEKHPEYDLNERVDTSGQSFSDFEYVNALVDKLLLFSYIIGETPIKIDFIGTEGNIGRYGNGSFKPIEERRKDLDYLRVRYKGWNRRYRNDDQLAELRTRLANRAIANGWITELGHDIAVIDYFQSPFTYRNGTFAFSSQQIKN